MRRPALLMLALLLILPLACTTSSTPSSDAAADQSGMDGQPPADKSTPPADVFSPKDQIAPTDLLAPTDQVADVVDDSAPTPDLDNADGSIADGSADLAETAAVPLPTFPHLDKVVDTHRGSVPVWATLLLITQGANGPLFNKVTYNNTGGRADFWPASTIKIYTAVATLQLLKTYGMSLDAKVSFYRKSGASWKQDSVPDTFRQIIYETMVYSSNSGFTLLLRFCGLDWLNTEFLTTANGFTKTALMRPYVGISDPAGYDVSVEQRIVLEENGQSAERLHKWGGTSYADSVGCTTYNTNGTGNCSSTDDMAEHLRRVFFHETLTPAQQFDLRQADLDWLRYGDDQNAVMGNLVYSAGVYSGITKVFPKAKFYHKAGSVTDYQSDLALIEDDASGTRLIMAINTLSTSKTTMIKVAEELTRMVETPQYYVHLASLKDNVNPVKATLWVYSATPAALDLVVKPFAEDGLDPLGWALLPGTEVDVPKGISDYNLTSSCLDTSEKVHIRGRLSDIGGPLTRSDLHYVVIDAGVACP